MHTLCRTTAKHSYFIRSPLCCSHAFVLFVFFRLGDAKPTAYLSTFHLHEDIVVANHLLGRIVALWRQKEAVVAEN